MERNSVFNSDIKFWQANGLYKCLVYITCQGTSPKKALQFLMFSPYSPGVYKKGDVEPGDIFIAYIRFIIIERPDGSIDGFWEDILKNIIKYSTKFSSVARCISDPEKSMSKINYTCLVLMTIVYLVDLDHLCVMSYLSLFQCVVSYSPLSHYMVETVYDLTTAIVNNKHSDIWKRRCLHSISDITAKYLHVENSAHWVIIMHFVELMCEALEYVI